MSNALRSAYQASASAMALAMVKVYGDTATYTTGAGSSYTIYVLAKAEKTTETFGPDEDRLDLCVPYQTNVLAPPDSGSTITFNGVKYAIESTDSDDGEFPVCFTFHLFRWMHASPEIQ